METKILVSNFGPYFVSSKGRFALNKESDGVAPAVEVVVGDDAIGGDAPGLLLPSQLQLQPLVLVLLEFLKPISRCPPATPPREREREWCPFRLVDRMV